MFPNVRLMVVAILAAIAGIGCGLGLFATFRVNHEPLARLAEGGPPMQLAFVDLGHGSDARPGLEVRLPVTGIAKIVSVPLIVPPPEPAAAEQAGVDSAIAAESAGVEQPDAGAETTNQSKTASLAVAVQIEPSNLNPEAADAAPSQHPEASDATPSPQEVIAKAQDRAPAAPTASAATASTDEQTAAVRTAALEQEPAVKPAAAAETKAAKPKARTSHPAASARRVIKTARARRPVATVAAQSAYPYSQPTYTQSAYAQSAYAQQTYAQPTYSQPTYTWINGAAQAAQPVTRVQIKRHRAVQQAAPVVPSNPSATTAGLNGTQ
jgi:hypothetical protein